ncbi:hypothetical protein [Nostoc commune]|nr:hypothetical protein [Nostoc commune]
MKKNSEAKPETLHLRSELSQLEIIMNQELTQAMSQNRFVAHIWLPLLQK